MQLTKNNQLKAKIN